MGPRFWSKALKELKCTKRLGEYKWGLQVTFHISTHPQWTSSLDSQDPALNLYLFMSSTTVSSATDLMAKTFDGYESKTSRPTSMIIGDLNKPWKNMSDLEQYQAENKKRIFFKE